MDEIQKLYIKIILNYEYSYYSLELPQLRFHRHSLHQDRLFYLQIKLDLGNNLFISLFKTVRLFCNCVLMTLIILKLEYKSAFNEPHVVAP